MHKVETCHFQASNSATKRGLPLLGEPRSGMVWHDQKASRSRRALTIGRETVESWASHARRRLCAVSKKLLERNGHHACQRGSVAVKLSWRHLRIQETQLSQRSQSKKRRGKPLCRAIIVIIVVIMASNVRWMGPSVPESLKGCRTIRG